MAVVENAWISTAVVSHFPRDQEDYYGDDVSRLQRLFGVARACWTQCKGKRLFAKACYPAAEGFGRLVPTLMAETFVAMLIPSHRGTSTEGDFQIGDRVVFAGKTLHDSHTAWAFEEDDVDDQGAIGFFQRLMRATALGVRSCMRPEVEAFWASQGFLEDGRLLWRRGMMNASTRNQGWFLAHID